MSIITIVQLVFYLLLQTSHAARKSAGQIVEVLVKQDGDFRNLADSGNSTHYVSDEPQYSAEAASSVVAKPTFRGREQEAYAYRVDQDAELMMERQSTTKAIKKAILVPTGDMWKNPAELIQAARDLARVVVDEKRAYVVHVQTPKGIGTLNSYLTSAQVEALQEALHPREHDDSVEARQKRDGTIINIFHEVFYVQVGVPLFLIDKAIYVFGTGSWSRLLSRGLGFTGFEFWGGYKSPIFLFRGRDWENIEIIIYILFPQKSMDVKKLMKAKFECQISKVPRAVDEVSTELRMYTKPTSKTDDTALTKWRTEDEKR